jgi:2-polyprenyl-3-methyl-5-hydroxy-6-metoxy-1,4-benzoquinol methylase
MPVYDPYVQSKDVAVYVNGSELSSYDVVFNSAMFEHVLCRDDLDDVRKILKPGGALIVHTVVCEEIPKDPNWFYLQPPVHTAFHTNKSMSLLMEQWDFKSSVYCPKGKSWLLFQRDASDIKPNIDEINLRLRSEWFLAKQGFVDYWK